MSDIVCARKNNIFCLQPSYIHMYVKDIFFLIFKFSNIFYVFFFFEEDAMCVMVFRRGALMPIEILFNNEHTFY